MTSEYFVGLSGEVKRRYLEKIEIIDRTDPYSLDRRNLSLDHVPDVSYIDMVNYLVYGVSAYTAEDFKAYKSLQAFNQFSCGWVSDVKSVRFSSYFLVMGKVQHSQRMNEKPLEPWFISHENGAIQSAHCNCMAGLGEACTHVAALMFFIQNMNVKKEDTSVTSTSPYWGQPSTKKVVFAEVESINFSTSLNSSRRNTKVNDVPEMDDNEFRDLCSKLQAAHSKSAILNIVKDFNDPDPATNSSLILSNLFEDAHLDKTLQELQCIAQNLQCVVSIADAEKIKRETMLQSKSRKWFAYRAGRITASNLKIAVCTRLDAPALTTVKRICYPKATAFHSKSVAWGCAHEKTARKHYLEMLKSSHQSVEFSSTGLWINPELPFMGASPDGLICCSCCGEGILEIKCPYCLRKEGDLKDHNCLKKDGEGVSFLDKKHQYYYQVQCQLFVTQKSYCDFVLWRSDELFIQQVLPDLDFWNIVVVKAEMFFRRVILPELLGKVFTQRCLPDGSDRVSINKKTKPIVVFL